MKNAVKRIATGLACASLAFGLTACGAANNTAATDEATQEETASADEAASDEVAVAPEEEVAEPTGIPTAAQQLGTTAFSVAIPEDFTTAELTEEARATGQVAHFSSEYSLLVIDVYQVSKASEGVAGTLAEFATNDAAAQPENSDLVTDAQINGIPVASYRSVPEAEGIKYDAITYILEDGDQYVKVLFWLDGDDAVTEADTIINSLAR